MGAAAATYFGASGHTPLRQLAFCDVIFIGRFFGGRLVFLSGLFEIFILCA